MSISKRIKSFALASMLWPLVGFGSTIEVGFNDYKSPTDNQLARDFVQTSFLGANPTSYVQKPMPYNATGGYVAGYTGENYGASAIYQPAFLDLSTPGASTSLSLDFVFNNQLTPLAPRANGVRSFRLGLVSDPRGVFENSSNPAIYVDGIFALDYGQMWLVARNVNDSGMMTSLTLAQTALKRNSLNRIEVSFTNSGNGNIHWDTTLSELSKFTSSPYPTPLILAHGSWDYQNTAFATDSSTYAGFSAFTAGGVPKVDNLAMTNFTVSPVVSPVPEPETYAMMLAGLGLMGGIVRRRSQKLNA